jgi:hypothetical protein
MVHLELEIALVRTNELISWLRSVYPNESPAESEARVVPRQVSSAGNTVYEIRCGPVLRKLLQAYGMFGSKVMPLAIQGDAAIRRALFEGILDGDGYFNNTYELAAKERACIDGYIHLARGLDFSTGKV